MDLEQMKIYIDDLQKKVEKDLTFIRAYKEDIQRFKQDVYSRIEKGQYIRDDGRIVISAPEIIIGNVDSRGTLLDSGSSVVIRTGNIRMDGVGPTSEIRMNAPQIIQRAINTGIDGLEEVVEDSAMIAQQARCLSLDAYNPTKDNGTRGVFPGIPMPVDGSILLHAESSVQVDAAKPGAKAKQELSQRIDGLTQRITDAKARVNAYKTLAESTISELQNMIKTNDIYAATEELLRVNTDKLEKANNQYLTKLTDTYKAVETYLRSVSELAELNRKKKSLQKDKEANSADQPGFKSKTTKSYVSIVSETVKVESRDADGNLRTNKGAGIFFHSCHTSFNAYEPLTEKKMSLMPYGTFAVSCSNITFDTDNLSEYTESDNDTKVESVHNPVGEFNISSKHVTIDSYKKKVTKTYTINGDETKFSVKEELQGYPEAVQGADGGGNKGGGDANDKGILTLKAHAINLSAANEKQEVDGTISLNAKYTELTAFNSKGTNEQGKEPAKETYITLLSEGLLIGLDEKNAFAKRTLVGSSDNTTIYSNKETSVAQTFDNQVYMHDSKLVLQAKSGVEVKGEKLTINPDGEFKANIKVTGAVHADGMEAKSGLVSPDSKDKFIKDSSPDKSFEKKYEKVDDQIKDMTKGKQKQG